MKTLLQIGSSSNYGAPGKIAEQIGVLAKKHGWDVYMAHGNKYQNPSSLNTFQTVTPFEEHIHEAASLLFDRHGLASSKQTRNLCRWIDNISPDVIHLHNIHGYFLNYKILFEYLKGTNIPIVWTFHDCWAFTGHCAYFDQVECDKWKTGCEAPCPAKGNYPKSLFFDRSELNYQLKKEAFSAVEDRLTIVPVSYWLENFVKKSFLKSAFCIKTIHNGINLDVFKPMDAEDLRRRLGVGDKNVVLGVAWPWVPRKGMKDMFELANRLPENEYQVVLVGLDEKQIEELPSNVIGQKRTNSARELAEYYSMASVFVNPTYEDNFPTTNIEALACGTPVVTYITGGSPEAIDENTGMVVDRGNINDAVEAIEKLIEKDKKITGEACRQRAVLCFDKDKCFKSYLNIYEELIRR